MIYSSLQPNARPLQKLISLCKLVFKDLQEDHHKLFGDAATIDEIFYRPAIEKVAGVIFIKQLKVRS